VRGTVRYLRQCERHGRKIQVPGEPSPALLLADKAPVLAVAGVVHPRLVISKRLLRGLTAEQRDAALRHERAHRTSRDNIKRFLILLAPDVLPFLRTFAALERSWAKFTEWAADDQATEGDSRRASRWLRRWYAWPRWAPSPSFLISSVHSWTTITNYRSVWTACCVLNRIPASRLKCWFLSSPAPVP